MNTDAVLMAKHPKIDISPLSYEERLDLIDELWDSIPPDAIDPLTPEQRAELERRLAISEANPDDAEAWEDVRTEVLRAILGVRASA